MFRKMLIGLATLAAIGIASMPMNASARGGGHGGGGFHGGGGAFHGGMAIRGPTGGGFGAARFAAMPSRTGFGGMSAGGFQHHHFHHRHFRNFVSFGIVAPYAYADYPYDDCYDLVRVRTHHGWRWQRIYVCG
jgi:hypothetical protein